MAELWDGSALSDEALLTGMSVGDQQAGVAFVRRFQRRVYGLAFQMLGDSSQAEDIAQEAIFRAWKHAPAFDPRRGSVVSWLLTITRNLAVDHLRMKRADPTDPHNISDPWPHHFQIGPDERVVADEDAAALTEVLKTLPVEQRRALVLASFGGRTAAEIGVIENIPLGTAKTRIRTALIKVRAAMVPTSELT
ncbi:MAG: RNA polymerase sigma factor [Acidimicrobiales bacterium]